MTVNFVSAGPSIPYVPVPVSAPVPAAPQPATHSADIQVSTDTEAQRQAALEHAAAVLQKEAYPVGDSTFTIYKDYSGQFVTRYVSLVDGKVSYFPEQSIFKFFQYLNSHGKLLNVSA
jgi:hypothetical protein